MRGYDPRSVLLFKDSSGLWIDPGWGLLFSQITLQPLSRALQWRLKTSDSDLWSAPLNAEHEGRNPLFPCRAAVESAWYSSRPCSPRSELRTRQRIASWSGGVLQMTSDLPPAWGDLNSGTPLKLPVPKPNPFFFFCRAIRRICLLLHTKTGTYAAPIICTWTVLFYSPSYRWRGRGSGVSHTFCHWPGAAQTRLKADAVPGYRQYISRFLMPGIQGGKWHSES